MAGVQFPKGQLNGAVDAVVAMLAKKRKETLEVIGIQLLSHIKLAYIEKSRGGTGEDGISWAPLKVSTILARLRKAGHLKSSAVKSVKKPAVPPRPRQRTIYTVAKTVKKNEALFKQLDAAGVVFHDKKGNQVKGSSPRHKTGTTLAVTAATQKKTVNLSPGSYQIGVDTGLQLNSAGPGFAGPDGKGGNIFEQDDVSVTIGFGRSYSSYFDEHRKLIPDTLPDDWQKDLDDLAAERGAKIITDVLDDKGVT